MWTDLTPTENVHLLDDDVVVMQHLGGLVSSSLFCVHKVTHPNRNLRLELQIQNFIKQNSLGVSGPDPYRNIYPTSLCGDEIFSGPGSDLPGSPGRSEPGPEILGQHNDLGVWSLSGPVTPES